MNITLIDCDPISYICGYSYRDSDYNHMLQKVDKLMTNILSATQADEYLGFLGGEKCFRHAVATTKPYKGNRSKEQPEWLQQWKKPICEHLVKEWGMQVVDGIEADDAIAICWEHYRHEHQVTIASPDKDLRQLHGMNFDFKKWEHTLISEHDAAYNFWYQMLTGDSTDGIPGLPNHGPVKARRVLEYTYDYNHMRDRVEMAYEVAKCSITYFQEQYTLLKMLTQPAYGFTVPHPVPVPLIDLLAEKKVYTASTPVSTNTNYLSSLGLE